MRRNDVDIGESGGERGVDRSRGLGKGEVEGVGGRHSLSHRARAMSGARSLVFCLRYDATASLVTGTTWCDVRGGWTAWNDQGTGNGKRMGARARR